jgi:translocation and assembly module TamA
VQRAQSDVARFQTALDSFGYYLNGVTIKIAGHELSDPELPEIMDAAPGNPPVTVDVAIDKGPLFHIGSIAFGGTVPAADRDAVRIRSGDPAIANAVLDAQAQLLAALQEDGYALATVEAPIAFADNEQHTVNLTYQVITGPRVALGRIVFSGLKDVHEDFVRKVLTVKPGDRYRPSRIEEARQAVAGLGVFSGVTVHAATKLDDDGRIALTFDVQERPQHAVTLTGTYSTDLGISLGATWGRNSSSRNSVAPIRCWNSIYWACTSSSMPMTRPQKAWRSICGANSHRCGAAAWARCCSMTRSRRKKPTGSIN